jgi:transglutaminase-like putative cysteine protease
VKYRIQADLQAELSKPVREHHVQLRLIPWADEWQRPGVYTLETEPFAHPVHHRDGFGNPLVCFALMGPHKSLSISLRAEVQTLLHNPFDYRPVPPRREMDWIHQDLRQAPRLWDFVLCPSPRMEVLLPYNAAKEAPRFLVDRSLVEQVLLAIEWVASVADRTGEGKGPVPATKSPDYYDGSTARTRLLIALVRSWGIPARFATGYLDPACVELGLDGQIAGPRRQSLRSWADVLIPGAGWRGFDPVSGFVVNDAYVRVAAGRDAEDVIFERASFKGEDAVRRTQFQIQVSPA